MTKEQFEELVKQEYDKMLKSYDTTHDILWNLLEKVNAQRKDSEMVEEE